MTTAPVESTHRQRAANRRTAALLFAIVAVFFVGFIASRYLADFATGMTVVGLAVLLFLVVAIGRNLRSGK
ncbi:MAG: cytochrome oxidase small assembly protein [Casimicrobiaceae bacterium]